MWTCSFLEYDHHQQESHFVNQIKTNMVTLIPKAVIVALHQLFVDIIWRHLSDGHFDVKKLRRASPNTYTARVDGREHEK